MKVLSDVLQNRYDNAILPFLWLRGEDEAQLRELMRSIRASGIGAVCAEARPHPDFVGPGWWHDLDILMDEAKRNDMRVWVLDDARFPTGYLNGRLSEFPSARKLLVDHYGVEVVGPAPGSAFMVRLEAEERLLGVVACRRDRSDPGRMLEAVNLTDRARGDTVYWDVPEGLWCVMVLKTTYNGKDRTTHINILDRDAVRLLLDVCYEPHYARYRAEFGGTFAGFFSDEPQVGNGSGRVIGVARMGNRAMMLSWTREIEEHLRAAWGDDLPRMLTACWYQIDGLSPAARLSYMDEVSRSFERNFSEQVAGWCHERGVEHIGHVIEDNGSHMRLGHGPAHYFRALRGQDMSGIDVVLQQIRPGLEDAEFLKITGQEYYDGRFFHNLLAKLGASLAHMDSKKKGRAMCEIFGAYGWSEGLKLMKWLADHMLVRGINEFVPHAFSLAEFPDLDCPPHFRAMGNNPQFPYFGYLMRYMNRVGQLIRDGRHIPCVALLYSAEGEWMDGDAQPLEEICLALNRAQIDYEIVPGDALISSPVKDGRFLVGEESMGALIVSERRYMSDRLCDWCAQARDAGVPVLYVGRQPERVRAGALVAPEREDGGEVVPLEVLTGRLRALGLHELACDRPQPYLRYYHYARDDGELILFFNEDPVGDVDCRVRTPLGDDVCWYDAFANELWEAERQDGWVRLRLSPYQALILVTPARDPARRPLAGDIRALDIGGEWTLTLTPAGKAEALATKRTALVNLCAPDQYPRFSGTMVYESVFTLDALPERLELDLGRVFETAQAFINGQEVGVRIAPPYVLQVDPALVKKGENTIVVKVVNTLGQQQRDAYSMSLPLEPVGLLGPVRLRIGA